MITKRKKSLIFLLLTIIVFAGLPICVSAGLPLLAKDAVILAFGDSLTFGTGAAPRESYPAVLERLVGRRVVNAGIPGEISDEGLERLPEVLKREKPALLILCHGANDLLRFLDKRQAAANLRAMIRLAREKGAAVVLIAVPSLGITLSPEPFYLEIVTEEGTAVRIAVPSLGIALSPEPLYREIAVEMGLPFEETALSALLSDSTFLSDPIHPNAAGYRRLAESIASLLKRNGAVK
ncbi:MAG: GDSL-type esterase/lipase family protein [Syntrophales bacterium]|nr:GDSL-type esterase/lipase family protein [Syntrophales bacterium]